MPFQRTTEESTKPVPSTVSVKAAPPAVALSGDSELVAGGGFVIRKVSALELSPPGVNTVTSAEPAEMRSLPGMSAWSRDALTYVVVRSAPFQPTTDDGRKLPP